MCNIMIIKDIIETDTFTDMPLSTQALFFHLLINAKNGKLSHAKAITRSVGASKVDLELLYDRSFIDDIEDENDFTVTVIKGVSDE